MGAVVLLDGASVLAAPTARVEVGTIPSPAPNHPEVVGDKISITVDVESTVAVASVVASIGGLSQQLEPWKEDPTYYGAELDISSTPLGPVTSGGAPQAPSAGGAASGDPLNGASSEEDGAAACAVARRHARAIAGVLAFLAGLGLARRRRRVR